MLNLIPNKKLDYSEELSKEFIERGISSFHAACDYVWKLPYGRTSDRANWKLVLTESRGACSTKHALLKALADELLIDIDLVVGIYPMTGKNTSGVGKVLLKHNVEYIPEAHCYLRYQDERLDFTRYSVQADEPINKFFSEISIKPNEIGEIKLNFHKNFIRNNYSKVEFERIWAIREECIAEIST
ncbi:hypothetical protein [Kangiella aquimarina]|uniref:Transglutaminase-like domain-containing protein n=1 Tax=Kangiella aquimarina TaxID=261965 RepID=A0ABZ0X7U5_9GAMM|nr:hypothetical protein [Kangiella aquimarina]WQG86322.1 hypothetical protein SR900_05400 [Kangiella aquimarina]